MQVAQQNWLQLALDFAAIRGHSQLAKIGHLELLESAGIDARKRFQSDVDIQGHAVKACAAPPVIDECAI